ncbi:hypothetical protein CPB84DRAFT_1826411 [Gymnopilus junonius]|uniref:Uncharacterized protein n=1 Tax=Gymnopilus junonius TaxID=109634 RepID=A0A9P5NK46_GYMJU|nr:hypothetical protein CPB84DRAFT_1826411 [Gymnopilus junonius]
MSLLNFYQNNDSSGSHAGRALISTSQNSLFELAEYNQAQMSMSYNPSEGLYHSRDTSRNHGHQDSLVVIRSASRQVLLASENAAYFELFQENMQLKGELSAKIVSKRELITHLMEKDKLGTTNQLIALSSTANHTLPSTLVIPDPPPPCDQADFEAVQYWTREEWTTYWGRQLAKGKTPSKLGFLCQKDGGTISEGRLNAMTKWAHELWAELYHERQNPPTWSNKNRSAAEFFSNSMRLEFEEFCYCSNDWKLEAFATVQYPDFTRNKGSSGHLALCSNGAILIKWTGRWWPRQVETLSQAYHFRKWRVVSQFSRHCSLSGPSYSTNHRGLKSSNPVCGICVRAARVLRPADASPPAPGTVDMSSGRESPTITTTSAPHQLMPSFDVIPIQVSLTTNDSTCKRPRPNFRETAKMLLLLHDELAPAKMSIYYSMTARNLFAIEYLKNHSPTVAEFKAIYDALDKVTIKVLVRFLSPSPAASFLIQKYEALSRQKKAETTSG